MTEAEWFVCGDPKKMLAFLGNTASTRKVRLFACACCYRVAHFLIDDRSRVAIEVLEKYADGQASDEQVVDADVANDETLGMAGNPGDAAACAVSCAVHVPMEGPTWVCGVHMAGGVAEWATAAVAGTGGQPSKKRLTRSQSAAKATETRAQANFLRDIFGNPFCSVAFSPVWRTALSLALQMYDSRDFSAMPILADALSDAGCDSPDILDHCRDPEQVHVRGCWVCDLVLNKA
jgi:hypothetical protein